MTALGWLFMGASVAFVTTLLVWCYQKILSAPSADHVVKPPDSLGG